MDKKNQIQQLINSRKLSTDEEYVLFEGALQALHLNITIDDIAEICKAFVGAASAFCIGRRYGICIERAYVFYRTTSFRKSKRKEQ